MQKQESASRAGGDPATRNGTAASVSAATTGVEEWDADGLETNDTDNAVPPTQEAMKQLERAAAGVVRGERAAAVSYSSSCRTWLLVLWCIVSIQDPET